MSLTKASTVHIDRTPVEVLDYMEHAFFPVRPFVEVQVDRRAGSATGMVRTGGSPSRLTVGCSPAGQGSTVTVTWALLSDSGLVGLLAGRKLQNTAVETAQVIKREAEARPPSA